MRIEESIEIARPPQEVWELVADPANDPLWCRKVQRVEQLGPGRWTVVHKPVPLRPAAELTVEHQDVQAPHRLTLREEDDAAVFHVEYRLEPTSAGTTFTQTSDFEWKRLPRLLHRPFARGVRGDLRGQLRALKKAVEDA